MARLGRVITEALLIHYGPQEFLRRLGDPFWFQSLGCVMGMDWHSSGITTSVMGALKRGLAPVQDELGIFVCGGRGRHSRKTPAELLEVGEREGLDGHQLGQTSRLVAKVDSAAVQDGYSLYLHSFVVTREGAWTVVQQGMDTERRQARRYHWLSEEVESFVEAPHSAIEGPPRGTILNLTDPGAARARQDQVSLVQGGPDPIIDLLRQQRHLELPRHHELRLSDVTLRRLHATLSAAADSGPEAFEDLLLTPGVGPRSVQALALVGEVIFGSPSRFQDPARFSFAHGGKDGHPFPVPLAVYDQTLGVLRRAVEAAKLGNSERLEALRRLDQQARLAERWSDGDSLGDIIQRERRMAPRLGGRIAAAPPRPRPGKPARPGPAQLSLFLGPGPKRR
jgi:hypothetical protein